MEATEIQLLDSLSSSFFAFPRIKPVRDKIVI
jgi:hypothetical protein